MKSTRRSFLKESSLALASLATTSAAFAASATPAFDPGFVHHGLYWLKDVSDQSTHADFVKSLRELRAIKEVKFLHVGAPTISEIPFEARATDGTYTVSYLVLFESKADKENYLKNPLHAQFVARFRDAVSGVKIYDSVRIPE